MDEETEACQRIIDARSPFECFQLPPKKTDQDVIRSIYLKLAVKVHPDKNKSNLATQAFQVLSDSFEELHDEEKQCQLLNQPCTTSWRSSKKKKRKAKDIADLVHQTNRWYTRDWQEVESEILRMTTEFKGHLARKQEAHERQAEKRAEKRERKNKRIKKNLNYLYEKYGIDPSDESSDSDDDKNTYDYLSYVPETPEICQKSSDKVATQSAAAASNVDNSAKQAVSSEPSICWVCKRSFASDAMLQVHYEKSELHRKNVEKSAKPVNSPVDSPVDKPVEKPVNMFKNSFSEVKDPT